MDPLATRVAHRHLVRAGIFEAPPAMLASIGAWVRSIYSGHVLASVEALLAKMRDGEGILRQHLAEMKGSVASLERDVRNLGPGKQVRYPVTQPGFAPYFIGIRRLDKTWWDTERQLTVHVQESSSTPPKPSYLPIYETGVGKRRVTYKYQRYTAVENHLTWAKEILERGVQRIQSALDQGVGSEKGSPVKIVNLVLLQRELLKHSSGAKSYTAKAIKKFPVDVTGWKYLRPNAPVIKKVNEGIIHHNETIQEQIDASKKSYALAVKAFELAQKSPDWEEDPKIQEILKDLDRRDWTSQWPHRVIWDSYETRSAIFEGKRPDKPMGYRNTSSGAERVTLDVLEKEKKPLLGPDDVAEALKVKGWDEIVVQLDFKGHKKTFGMWFQGKRQLTVDVRGRTPESVELFQDILRDILRTLRHELQHVGQDVLTTIQDLKMEAGTPAQDIRVQPTGKPSTKRKEHALREEEFYTRLADEIDMFVDAARSMAPSRLRSLFQGWTQGGDRSEFFRRLRQEEPLKWQKAVKEFAKGIRARGIAI